MTAGLLIACLKIDRNEEVTRQAQGEAREWSAKRTGSGPDIDFHPLLPQHGAVRHRREIDLIDEIAARSAAGDQLTRPGSFLG